MMSTHQISNTVKGSRTSSNCGFCYPKTIIPPEDFHTSHWRYNCSIRIISLDAHGYTGAYRGTGIIKDNR